MLCVNPRGEGSWKLAPSFLPALPHGPFPFADLALSPFTVRNHSLEYDCMLSPVNPSPSTKTGGEGLLTHTHNPSRFS